MMKSRKMSYIWMDLIWISAHVWLISLASVENFVMFEKQLQQQSNAGNSLGFACNERKIYKGEEQLNWESKQVRSFWKS